MTKKKQEPATPATESEVRLERMKLSTLLAMRHEKNPKEHDLEALMASFARFGFTAFPTIDEASQVMVAGHGRCEALARLRNAGEAPPRNVVEDGIEWLVPVVRGIAFASTKERDAYVVADNQHVMNGGWHFDRLTEMLGELGRDGGTYEGLGFEQVELDNLLGNYAPDDNSGGFDPEERGGTSNEPDGNKGKTKITARVECPNCKHVFER